MKFEIVASRLQSTLFRPTINLSKSIYQSPVTLFINQESRYETLHEYTLTSPAPYSAPAYLNPEVDTFALLYDGEDELDEAIDELAFWDRGIKFFSTTHPELQRKLKSLIIPRMILDNEVVKRLKELDPEHFRRSEVFDFRNLDELIILGDRRDQQIDSHRYKSPETIAKLKEHFEDGFREKKKIIEDCRIPKIIIYPIGVPLPDFRDELPTPEKALDAWAAKERHGEGPKDAGGEDIVGGEEHTDIENSDGEAENAIVETDADVPMAGLTL